MNVSEYETTVNTSRYENYSNNWCCTFLDLPAIHARDLFVSYTVAYERKKGETISDLDQFWIHSRRLAIRLVYKTINESDGWREGQYKPDNKSPLVIRKELEDWAMTKFKL